MSVDLGFHHMMIHNTDLEHWCAEWDLEPFVCDCVDCGRRMRVDLPFSSKARRGLRAEPCMCGSRSVPFTYVDLGYDTINLNYLGTVGGSSTGRVSEGRSREVAPRLRLVDTSRG